MTLDGKVGEGDVVPQSNDDDWLYNFHGWSMWISWALIGLMQIVSNRYMKKYWRVAMYVHILGGLIIEGFTLTSFYLMFNNFGW